MSDAPPSYEEIEKAFSSEPTRILDALPDCIASRRAKQLMPTVYDYVKEARDQVRRSEPAPAETPSEASMRRARESGIAWFQTEPPAPVVVIPHASTGLCCCPRCWSQGC